MKPIEWKHESMIGKPICVRVNKETASKIEDISKTYSIKESTIIRMIVENYFEELKGE